MSKSECEREAALASRFENEEGTAATLDFCRLKLFGE